MDLDTNRNLAAEYGVTGVPTLIFFADGAVKEQLVGLQRSDRIRESLDKLLD